MSGFSSPGENQSECIGLIRNSNVLKRVKFLLSDVTDPVGDVTRFIRNFNDKYGTEHPTFYQGSYSQVSLKKGPQKT